MRPLLDIGDVMPHESTDSLAANRLFMAQIDRYVRSGMDAETFLNQPYEEEMSALMLHHGRRHKLRMQSEAQFPSPK